MHFFNRVTLQTPESVELDFTLAGIGNRAYALLIDYIIWSLILLFFILGSSYLSIQLVDVFSEVIGDNVDLELWFFSIQLIITFAIYVGYFVFFETLWRGQTPGKRFVKIRVIRDDGRPTRLQQATLRAVLRPVDDLMFLGVFLIIFSKQEKRLGDWLAGTIVIQEERSINAANFSVSPEAANLASQLILEADLSRLIPEDFAIIREYLQRRKIMTPPARIEKARQLAYQVKDIIGLEVIPERVTATQFLEAVYVAYQQ
ncbi:RDD family protein [Oscillatoria salina]|uniref:RDD family protein n=1 Tax=Oscillatoria salina TaxID=331517 RepID=UPI0013BC007F|nr:RDD family protein [Oscillatoria salina]MBZ8181155.1 RDD family protein [Oscillatoria salina IIICB1]NET88854.1 RDD family protein [Kamptonema sp. SIO1D9]